MPPRCAVSCSRAVLRSGPLAQDGIWITDAMLLRAIERYHRLSATSTRHLSSTPGPLESRRRLGKRHMTGIIPESHAPPPPWSIELPWQLGEWQWEAPTAPEDRKNKLPKRTMMDRLIRWLENYEDTPIAHSPPTAEPLPSTRIQQSIATIRQQVKTLGTEGQASQVISLVRGFQQDLERVIGMGMATAEDLILALNLLDSDSRRFLHNTPYWDRVTASIGQTIVKGIVSSRSDSSNDAYGKRFWFSLIQEVCKLTPQRETFELFASCVNALPRSHFEVLSHYDLFDMGKSFIAYQVKRRQSKPSDVLQFTKALKRITPMHTAQLWDSMVNFLCNLPEEDVQQRFYGALLLAHDRHITSEEFMLASKQLCRNQSWSEAQAFSLLRGRLWSLGSFRPQDVGWLFSQKADEQGWSSLVMTAWRSQGSNKRQALRELCYVSEKLGCLDSLFKALLSTTTQGTKVLEDIAIAAGDYRLVMKLWVAFNKANKAAGKSEQWHWSTWSLYVHQMIRDPDMDAGIIWKVLATGKTTDNVASPDRVLRGIKTRDQLFEMVAQWFLEAPHLSDRQALRRVESCIKHSRRLTGTVSKKSIGSLVQVVLRDMEKGELGSSARLEFVVSVIRRHLGDKEADAALKQIRGWRWTIENHAVMDVSAKQTHGQLEGAVGDKATGKEVQSMRAQRTQEMRNKVSQEMGVRLEDDVARQMTLLRREAA